MADSLVESVFYYPQGTASNFLDICEQTSSSSSSTTTTTAATSSLPAHNTSFNSQHSTNRGFGSALASSTSFPEVKSVLRQILSRPVSVDGTPCFSYGETPESVDARTTALRECVDIIDRSTHQLFSDLNKSAFESVASFLQSAYDKDGCCKSVPLTAPTASTTTSTTSTTTTPSTTSSTTYRQQFLPTAIVCAGLNLSDHGLSFGHLTSHLTQHCTPHVASLRARNAGTADNSMHTILKQFETQSQQQEKSNHHHHHHSSNNSSNNSNSSNSSDNHTLTTLTTVVPCEQELNTSTRNATEEDGKRQIRDTTQAVTAATDAEIQARDRRRQEVISRRGGRNGRKPKPIQMLVDWYNKTYRAPLAPRAPLAKSRNSTTAAIYRENLPVLIVFIEDFEFFKLSVIQDLLAILAHAHHHQLPLALVLGVASIAGADAVHSRIPRPLTSLLWMRSFELDSSVATLEKVVDRLLMRGEVPLLLGSKAVNWLMDQFLLHTFSVTSFLRGLKLIALEHYTGERASALCVSLGNNNPEKRAKELVDALGYDDLRYLNQLKSVQTSMAELAAARADDDEEGEGEEREEGGGSRRASSSSSSSAVSEKDSLEQLRVQISKSLILFHRRRIAGYIVFCCFMDAQDLAATIQQKTGLPAFTRLSRRKLYVETLGDPKRVKKCVLKITKAVNLMDAPALKMLLKTWTTGMIKHKRIFATAIKDAVKIALALSALNAEQDRQEQLLQENAEEAEGKI